MKYKYRVVTALRPSGTEVYSVQLRPWFFPLWFELEWFWDEQSAIDKMNLEKRIDAFKGKVVSLG